MEMTRRSSGIRHCNVRHELCTTVVTALAGDQVFGAWPLVAIRRFPALSVVPTAGRARRTETQALRRAI